MLILVVAILVAYVGAAGQQTSDDRDKLKLLQTALDVIKAKVIMDHIKKLASDEFEGRGPGTRGETLTVDYLVDQFKRAGLKPGNPDGTFVQKVPLVGFQTIPEIDITTGGQTQSIKFMDDFVHDFPALRPLARVKNAGVIFAGYGIVAPEYGWDDYRGVDVRNKLIIVLSGEPSRPDKTDPKKMTRHFLREIREPIIRPANRSTTSRQKKVPPVCWLFTIRKRLKLIHFFRHLRRWKALD